jgi:hypothetical protein
MLFAVIAYYFATWVLVHVEKWILTLSRLPGPACVVGRL